MSARPKARAYTLPLRRVTTTDSEGRSGKRAVAALRKASKSAAKRRTSALAGAGFGRAGWAAAAVATSARQAAAASKSFFDIVGPL